MDESGDLGFDFSKKAKIKIRWSLQATRVHRVYATSRKQAFAGLIHLA